MNLSFDKKLADSYTSPSQKIRVLIKALVNKEDLTSSQAITLFKLAKKKNSDIEKDVKGYKPTL